MFILIGENVKHFIILLLALSIEDVNNAGGTVGDIGHRCSIWI